MLIIDVKSIPNGNRTHEIIDWYSKTGIMIWDSSNGGEAPKITCNSSKKLKIKNVKVLSREKS